MIYCSYQNPYTFSFNITKFTLEDIKRVITNISKNIPDVRLEYGDNAGFSILQTKESIEYISKKFSIPEEYVPRSKLCMNIKLCNDDTIKVYNGISIINCEAKYGVSETDIKYIVEAFKEAGYEVIY